MQKRGGYGNMGGASGRSNRSDVPKQYPKSANFARLPTGLEVAHDEAGAPHSARAAVKSWSSTGGVREATFKKKPPSNAKLDGNSAVGFAVILQQAERPYSLSSLSDTDDAEDPSVALLMEELILKVEEDGMRTGPANSILPLATAQVRSSSRPPLSEPTVEDSSRPSEMGEVQTTPKPRTLDPDPDPTPKP